MLIEYGIARRKPAMPSPARLVRPALLAAALCAANLAVAAQPASAPFTPAQQQAIRQISASAAQAQVPLVASAAAASVAKTIEGEKQAIDVAKDALEVGRKSVDWWLTALGLVMALAGIGLSVWLSRKHDEVEVKLKEADAAKQKAEIALRHAEQLIENFSKQASLIPNADAISDKLSADVLEKLKMVKPPQVVKLIEQAWAAHHQKNWVIAKPLWELLSLIESQDANVWFNLAYAEQHAGKDFQLICDGYQRSHLLEPSAEASNNWGNALSDWANTLTGEAQQQRFAEADQRYAEANRLKPYFAEAYSNWGNALLDWALTLQGDERQTKLARAEEVLLLAKNKGAKSSHYNLACLRAVQQRPDEACTLLKETYALLDEIRTAGLVPDFAHLSTDPHLENLRGLDWFQALLEQVKQQEAGKQGST
ncbi:hypothetical protein [Vogesella sp. XCS3]|uniref:hypothetical protein n=1 Tax=Vogesella sp. XCS3 TaxID=2877939 RepID=UPI001D0A3607|nr:hypothetical protein [Vogesella sp. XCS3]UDM16206.1 hypothetical protein LCH97_13015 [Vogesella sp. XCS3]